MSPRFDPRLSGRPGPARAGGGGAGPARYPASHHGPSQPVALPGSGLQFIEQTPEVGPPPAVGAPPWEKAATGTKEPPFGGWFPTVQSFDVVTANAGFSLTGASDLEIVAFDVPSKCRAVLTAWGHECCDVTAWASITWSIRINRSVQPGYRWATQVAGVEDYRLCKGYLAVPQGSRISLFGTNASVGALVVFGRIKGYYWPYEESF